MAEEWKGEVDKVEMHDHALTPEEIASMGAYGTYAERVRALAVAYWPALSMMALRGQLSFQGPCVS